MCMRVYIFNFKKQTNEQKKKKNRKIQKKKNQKSKEIKEENTLSPQNQFKNYSLPTFPVIRVFF